MKKLQLKKRNWLRKRNEVKTNDDFNIQFVEFRCVKYIVLYYKKL